VIEALNQAGSKDSEDAIKVAKEMERFKKQFHELQEKHIEAVKQNDWALAHELVGDIHTVQENALKLVTSRCGEITGRWFGSLDRSIL
jgi:hypothetical protein